MSDSFESFIKAQTDFYHKLYPNNDIPDFLINEAFNSDQDLPFINEDVNHIEFMGKIINQLIDLNINDNPIQYNEVNLLVDKNVDSMRIGRRNLDLHGYTEKGSLQATRRLLLLLDKTHPNVVKFNVGIGSHSEPSRELNKSDTDNEAFNHVTRNAVKQVCIKELNLPHPQPHPINKGYLIERLPTSVFNEATGN